MSLLAPAALGALALALPLVALYMLRSRRRRVVVPSVLLWERAGEAVSSSVPWQPLRVTPVLALQLLVLALLALSLARPFVARAGLLGPHTVLVIDTSGSMAMAGRLEAARQEALRLVEEASATHLVSVVEAGPRPRVLASFSRDPVALRELVASLQPTGGEEDLAGALRLARGLAAPDRPTGLLILSDGGPADRAAGVEEPILDARHLRFGGREDNLAVTALSTEPSGEIETRVFVEVSNFGAAERVVDLEVAVDGVPAGRTALRVGPSARARHTFPVEADPGAVVAARLPEARDGLSLDDQADLVVGSGPERAVAVLGEGSVFLQALVEAAPGFAPAAGRAPDVLVVDRVGAGEVDRPAWLIRPETPPPGVRVTGLLRNAVVTYQRPGEPLLEGIDLSDLAVAEAQVVEAPGWLPLVRAGEVPLVLLGEVEGRRAAYFAFDLTHSDLPVRVGFPLLGSRLLDWLAGSEPEAGEAAPAGTSIALSPPPEATVEVTRPDGRMVSLPAGTVLYEDTGAPGVYRIAYRSSEGTVTPGPAVARRFAPGESAGGSRELEAVPPAAQAAGRGG